MRSLALLQASECCRLFLDLAVEDELSSRREAAFECLLAL